MVSKAPPTPEAFVRTRCWIRFFRLEAHHWARGIPDDGVGIGSEPTQHFVQSSSSDDD
jgi:hypothetical protein